MRRLLLIILSVLALPAHADVDLPKTVEDPILTIQVAQDSYQLDYATLETLPEHRFTTTTIWTDGPQEFVGVKVADLLNQLMSDAKQVSLTAANGYQIDVPADHYHEVDAIIAYLRNGEQMTLRDKGPLWIVYPYDSHPRYKSEIMFANSIWQLERIDLKN